MPLLRKISGVEDTIDKIMNLFAEPAHLLIAAKDVIILFSHSFILGKLLIKLSVTLAEKRK